MRTFFIILYGSLFFSSLAFAASSAHDFRLLSSAFENNGTIPRQYTCDGDNMNPPLKFKNIPFGTKSLALIVFDDDAPGGRWSHWVVYNIPPIEADVGRDTSPGAEGVNDFGKEGYGGPCPPGGKLHHYIFCAYALDSILNINGNPSIVELEKAVKDHIVDQTQMVGTYQK